MGAKPRRRPVPVPEATVDDGWTAPPRSTATASAAKEPAAVPEAAPVVPEAAPVVPEAAPEAPAFAAPATPAAPEAPAFAAPATPAAREAPAASENGPARSTARPPEKTALLFSVPTIPGVVSAPRQSSAPPEPVAPPETPEPSEPPAPPRPARKHSRDPTLILSELELDELVIDDD